VSTLKQAFSGFATVDRLRSSEKRMPSNTKGWWVTSIYVGYILVVKSLNNEQVLYVDVEESTAPGKGPDAADDLYSRFHRDLKIMRYNPGYGGEVTEIRELVDYARYKRDYSYMISAAEKANELLGSKDGFVEIPLFKVRAVWEAIPRDEAVKVVELGAKVADIFTKLGGRAEAELQKLIFSGYKEGILNTIEGLTEEDKKFLQGVLEEPLHRAALLFAYKKVGNYKKLLPKILYAMHYRNIPYIQYY